MSDVVTKHQITRGILWCHSRSWPFKYKMSSLYLLTCKILLLLTQEFLSHDFKKKRGFTLCPKKKKKKGSATSTFILSLPWVRAAHCRADCLSAHADALMPPCPSSLCSWKEKTTGSWLHGLSPKGYFLTLTCPCVIQSAKYNFEYLSFGLRGSLNMSDWILLSHFGLVGRQVTLRTWIS